ncbi:hypothetical protein RvY_17914 [Ramazzottius varieornatus]|uniref:Uncharacterized protein n=1 Tax=Ramazzottius varieornatus TaxID=947166 RepID=A0A1D1W5T3_RAMVA|nr:hypothetical protein RvY_17914 [Ramazzottius varieornatus]
MMLLPDRYVSWLTVKSRKWCYERLPGANPESVEPLSTLDSTTRFLGCPLVLVSWAKKRDKCTPEHCYCFRQGREKIFDFHRCFLPWWSLSKLWMIIENFL